LDTLVCGFLGVIVRSCLDKFNDVIDDAPLDEIELSNGGTECSVTNLKVDTLSSAKRIEELFGVTIEA